MKKRMISFIIILLLIVLAGILLAGCGSSSSTPVSSGASISTPASSGSSPSTPASSSGTTAGSTADGQTLMQQRCTVCHSTGRITSAHMTAAQWQATVDKMINNGAQLTPQEEQTLVTYLAQNYK